ncbi:FliH/SctL family protein [Lacipirellula sp.]|uniref:FliH/SctL family protein n=1 Tax=Lacipirellula sp. TaxID=2691419 RepID=UPI003D0E15D2
MATIIKTHGGQNASGPTLRSAAYDLTDMTAQADQYLAQIRTEAVKIVEQARQEAAAVKQQAEAAGKQAAEAAIERILDEKVAQQMRSLTPALQAAAKQVEDAKQEWLRHWERTAIELAAAMAERIIRGELSRRPEITLEWVRESLQLAAGTGDMSIQLSPADQSTLKKQVQQIAAVFAPLANVTVTASPAIAPGGCRLVTEFGVIDQQIETQLARIKEELA